jgi:2-polyprenyl-6-methoxyphenol hydroxylase-like FAD-dependent oxidoreductase
VTGSFDVVIVGARCAGSPLATMLARRGLGVCVLDKAGLPSDTPSTHAIQPNGVRVLRRLSIADALAASTDPLTKISFAVDGTRADSHDLLPVFGAPGLNIRRTVLDAYLADRARDAGATLRTGTAVTGVLRDETGRVAGVTTDDGEIRAGLVVGADGTRSTVARLAGAREYLRTEIGRVFQWGYFGADAHPKDTLWFGNIAGTGYLAGPTDDGLFMAAVATDRSKWPGSKRDPRVAFDEGLRGWPELAEMVVNASPVGRLRVMARGHCYFRESAGPGWVLVGDAGHFKDPTPGQGIADALRQAERLAPAIERALGGAGAQPLLDWWSWRDSDAMEMYWLAHQFGSAGPVPQLLQEMLAQLLSTEDGVERFARMMDHTLPPSSVFGPALLARGLTRGLRTRREQRGQLIAEARTLIADQVRRRLRERSARRELRARDNGSGT